METRKRERHGMSGTRAYHAWAMMKQRCYNTKQARSERYHGRGIEVCDRWRDSFVAFLEDMGEPPEGMSLDRIDNDGDYCPENCRWATPAEQANNTSRTRRVKVGGEIRLAKDVAEELGINYGTMMARLRNGRSLEQALGLDEYHPENAITVNGETMTFPKWAERLGISRQALMQRLKRGWTIEEALTAEKHTVKRPTPRGISRNVKRHNNGLGAYLTKLRVAMGWSQEELGNQVGLTTSQISGIERDKRQLSLDEAHSIAQALSVSISDLADRLR